MLHAFDLRTMQRHSVSLIIGDPKVVDDIHNAIDDRGGTVLRLDDIDYEQSDSDAVLQATFRREKNGVDVIAYQKTLTDLCPNFKTHIGYIFMSATTDADTLERLYEDYVGLYDTVEDFRDILNIATVNGSYMVIDNVTDSTDCSDIVFKYGGPVAGSFKRKQPEDAESSV